MKHILQVVAIVLLAIAPACAQTEPPPAPPSGEMAGPSDLESVLADVNAFEAPRLGMLLAPTPHGELLIIGIRAASPAERAGLRRGDFITKIDGKDIPSVERLKEVIRSGSQRDSAMLETWRGGKTSQHHIFLLPEEKAEDWSVRPWAGLQCRHVPEKGLVIESVFPGGPAAEAGLRPGDVLVSAAGREIKSLLDAEKLLHELEPFAEVKTVVERDGKQVTATVKTVALCHTPGGIVLQHAPHAPQAPVAQPAHGSAIVEQERWEAEQRQRLEQLLQEIRQDVKAIQTRLDSLEKDG